VHPERLEKIRAPQMFIFNHVGVYDVFQDFRAMPADIRRKTAVAMTSQIWQHRWQVWFVMLYANGFPFIRTEAGDGNNATKGNFERVGEILDKGFNIFISPEANITKTGELLPFHTGIGYIAIEMDVPVTIFKLKGYFELWPEDLDRKLNLFWPKKFGRIEVVVSDPITFKPGTSYEEATEILRQTMLHL
jgi:1-acyl-sn-glycerol-3-phosphate acyltransferase